MFIRFLEGPFKGQTKDVENGAAVELIRAGKAENPYLDPTPAPKPKRQRGAR